MQALAALWPILARLGARIIEGIREGKSADEIRESLARSDIVSDEAIDQVRGAAKKVDDYIKNG